MSVAYDANEFYTGSDLLRPISEATGLSIDKVLLTTRRAAHWVSFLNIRRFDNIITTTQVTFFVHVVVPLRRFGWRLWNWGNEGPIWFCGQQSEWAYSCGFNVHKCDFHSSYGWLLWERPQISMVTGWIALSDIWGILGVFYWLKSMGLNYCDH